MDTRPSVVRRGMSVRHPGQGAGPRRWLRSPGRGARALWGHEPPTSTDRTTGIDIGRCTPYRYIRVHHTSVHVYSRSRYTMYRLRRLDG